jgi:hypothetical protein
MCHLHPLDFISVVLFITKLIWEGWVTQRFLRAQGGIAGNPREPRALYYLMMMMMMMLPTGLGWLWGEVVVIVIGMDYNARWYMIVCRARFCHPT